MGVAILDLEPNKPLKPFAIRMGSQLPEAESDLEASEYPYEVAAYFEQVGFLTRKKYIDIDVIADRLSTHIISNWKKLEPWITALRKEKGDELFGEHFQELYEKTVKYIEKNRKKR